MLHKQDHGQTHKALEKDIVFFLFYFLSVYESEERYQPGFMADC